MKVLSKEEIKVLANENGWSLAHAEGYVTGDSFRLTGKTPSRYVQIGIDDYSLGFRAGYYERRSIDRQTIASIAKFTGHPTTHIASKAAEDSVVALDTTMVPALSAAG